MAYITLAQAKQHLNLESSYTEDDTYISGLCLVAEEAVAMHVNDKLDEIAEEYGGTLPYPLIQAMLLCLGNLYLHRESTTNGKNILPYGYDYLIDLYKNYNN